MREKLVGIQTKQDQAFANQDNKGPVIPKMIWASDPFPSGTFFRVPYSIENAREAASM